MKIEEIQTVKKCEFGFMVNGTAFVPNQEDIYDYQVIQDWVKEKGNFIEDMHSEEELEYIRISGINAKTEMMITAKYPIYKQLNIRAKLIKNDLDDDYTDFDIEEMDVFINTVRSIAKQAKANGTAVEDIDWNIQ